MQLYLDTEFNGHGGALLSLAIARPDANDTWYGVWTVSMDLNKRDAAELNADLVMVVQAVHRDAGREYHALLKSALSAMPPMQIISRDPSELPNSVIFKPNT